MADLTRLLTATIERVENFHKAKELEVHFCAERGAGGSRILTRCVTEIGRGVAYGNWKPCASRAALLGGGCDAGFAPDILESFADCIEGRVCVARILTLTHEAGDQLLLLLKALLRGLLRQAAPA